MFDDSNSFIHHSNDSNFFSQEELEQDKDELGKYFFYTKETDYLHDINSVNMTNFPINDEKNNGKLSVDLDETSQTLLTEDDNEINNDYSFLLENQIFTITKTQRKSKSLSKKKKKRKNDSDTMRRKIKTYYHKYIFDTIHSLIKKNKLVSSKLNLKLLKMNNRITSTVSIQYNKDLLHISIGTILETEPISSKYKHYDKDNNAKLIKMLKLTKDNEMNRLLQLNYLDMYEEYLSSGCYNNLLKKMKKKEGKDYMKKFELISRDFINYYIVNEPKNDNKKQLIFGNEKQTKVYSKDTVFDSIKNLLSDEINWSVIKENPFDQ